MNIQQVGLYNQTTFSANTKIIAPEKLLNNENRTILENLGKKIGKTTDYIEFSISDLHVPEKHPNVKTYTVSKMLKLGNMNSFNKHDIPYEKDGKIMEQNSPFNYIKKILENYI